MAKYRRGRTNALTMVCLSIDLAGGATREVLAKQGANIEIWVYGIFLTAAGAGTVSFLDEDANLLAGNIVLAANGQISLPFSGDMAMPWFRVPANKDFDVALGSGVHVDGILVYALIET